MKKYIWMATVIAVVLFTALNAYALELTLDNYAAGASYNESTTAQGQTLKSKWSSFYYKGNLALSKFDNKQLQGELFYGMSVSPTATERWDINGNRVQNNDMSFWGIDTGVDAGWAIPIWHDKMDVYLAPLIGYRWKYIRFTRSNFNILNTFHISETIDENYNVQSLDLGGRLDFKLNDKISLFVKPIFGIVLYDCADNSAAGTINGDGGFFFNLDAGANYALTKNFDLGMAFRMELQRLNGATKDNVIWPDNSLDTYGGTVSGRYRF